MDVLRFYVLFNSISVILGRWAGDNERLCAMEPRLRLKTHSYLALGGARTNDREISWPALNPLNYRGSDSYGHLKKFHNIRIWTVWNFATVGRDKPPYHVSSSRIRMTWTCHILDNKMLNYFGYLICPVLRWFSSCLPDSAVIDWSNLMFVLRLLPECIW